MGEFFIHKWPKGAERIWEEEHITKQTKQSVMEIDHNQVIIVGNSCLNYKPTQKRFSFFDDCIVLVLLPHPSTLW